MPHDEPLQGRRIHHREFIHHGQPKEHALEFLAKKANKLWQAVADDKGERLKLGAGSEHVAEIAVLDAGVEKDELPEVGEDAGPVEKIANLYQDPKRRASQFCHF